MSLIPLAKEETVRSRCKNVGTAATADGGKASSVVVAASQDRGPVQEMEQEVEDLSAQGSEKRTDRGSDVGCEAHRAAVVARGLRPL